VVVAAEMATKPARNHRTPQALSIMSNAFSRAARLTHQQVARVRGPMNLTRGLLWVWLALSVLWIGCILVISGQCLYGPWIGWQPSQCDAPLINPIETYIADLATALGPPAAVLLLHRLVMWWSRRYRRSR
jgi:hypothetical protein